MTVTRAVPAERVVIGVQEFVFIYENNVREVVRELYDTLLYVREKYRTLYLILVYIV